MSDERVPSDLLVKAALNLMTQNGYRFEKVPGLAQKYALTDGKTFRIRTNNDHVLMSNADRPDPNKAKLNMEGTDYLLVVMPETPRTHGNIIAYYLPTAIASKTVRAERERWLSTNPNTHGNNKSFNIWFRPAGKAGDYDKKWAEYRLPGTARTDGALEVGSVADKSSLSTVVEVARAQVASAAGVPVSAVRITVDFSS